MIGVLIIRQQRYNLLGFTNAKLTVKWFTDYACYQLKGNSSALIGISGHIWQRQSHIFSFKAIYLRHHYLRGNTRLEMHLSYKGI